MRLAPIPPLIQNEIDLFQVLGATAIWDAKYLFSNFGKSRWFYWLLKPRKGPRRGAIKSEEMLRTRLAQRHVVVYSAANGYDPSASYDAFKGLAPVVLNSYTQRYKGPKQKFLCTLHSRRMQPHWFQTERSLVENAPIPLT